VHMKLTRLMRTPSKRENPFIAELEANGVPASFFLSASKIKLGEKLGSGAFGTIHSSAVSGWENSAVVAKVIKPQKLKPADAALLRNEVIIWRQMEHDNIVTFLGMSAEPHEVRLVCERCNGGTLEDALERATSRREPRLPMHAVTGQMLQIARALEHVHCSGFMHRDLKPANVLVEGSTLKLSDFGLACVKPKVKSNLTAETGSYRWMAPEVMRHEPYDEKCDMYSFGLICWSMLTRSLPFPSLSPIDAAFAVADQAKRPRVPANCSADLTALIERCWAPESEARPSSGEVVGPLTAMAHVAPNPNEVIGAASLFAPALKFACSPPGALRRAFGGLLSDTEILTISQPVVSLSAQR